jgi:3-oxoacyl-[acyl-carrier-protein] synthase III
MGIKASFLVRMSPDPFSNKLMRSLDLFEPGAGLSVERVMTVTWKDGEKVGKRRIEKMKENLKNALEKTGYDCFDIKYMGKA